MATTHKNGESVQDKEMTEMMHSESPRRLSQEKGPSPRD